jgi:hypothetical protein
MRQKLRLLTTLGLVCSFAACASYTAGSVPPDARPLEAAPLQALLDNTHRSGLWFNDGYSGGLSYSFAPAGKLEVRSRYVTSKVVTGRWRIQTTPTRLCTQIENDQENCHVIYQLPGDRIYVDAPNLSMQANTFVVGPR